jgi:multiple sugar transport system permease protein
MRNIKTVAPFSRTETPRRTRDWLWLRGELMPYFFLAPTLVALLLFSVYPFIMGILFAFQDVTWFGGTAHWIGLENFQRILEGSSGSAQFFRQALKQTVIWTVGVVGGQLVLGYATALLLNQRVPGRWIFRTLILVPWALPSVVVALTWQWLYDPFFGLINHYLNQLGLIHGPKVWVGQPNSSIGPIMLVGIWRGLPFMALMLLSGLQAIPEELYDAAKVDGANLVQRFRFITLPLMRTITAVVVMLTTMWWWNSFDLQKIMSPVGNIGNRTMTLPVLAWYEAFNWHHLGRGAAISVISLLLMLVVMIPSVRREMRTVDE